MELLNHINKLRKKNNLTQAQLAEAIGVSRKTINTIENRIFVPSTVLALRLAIELKAPVEKIFELSERKKS